MEMETMRNQNLIVAFVNDWIGFYILIGIGIVGFEDKIRKKGKAFLFLRGIGCCCF